MKKLLLILALLLMTFLAHAATLIDGIYYNLNSSTNTAHVTSGSNKYTGTVSIPSTVSYNGRIYNVTSIGDYAFRDCSGLTSVTIPNSVTSIGDNAFYNCKGMKSIVIPNSVTSIGENAFYNCKGLKSIVIPNSVTSIGKKAFEYCSELTSVNISDIAAWCSINFSSSSANPLTYAHNLYLNGNKVTDLIIPNSVTSIGGSAFWGCSGLTSVTIPNSVTSIGDWAFSYCSGLTSVIIPNSVTSIGIGVFRRCTGLTSVTIPNSVTSIGDWAFCDCSGLTSITIPNSVTSIGGMAFAHCSNLTSVTIPNSVTSIGDGAFCDCSGLTSITIPNSVTSIGGSAFYGCSGLTSVNIGNSVTSIGDWAFCDCSGLTSITIPNSVTSIGGSAFYRCSGLTSVNISDIAAWCRISFDYSGNPLRYAHNLYLNGNKVTDLIIPNSVTSIGDYAFEGCSGLTSVTIPNSVTSIGECAFYECSSLTSVDIPNSVTSIGGSAFSSCSGLTSVTIPNSVTSIGNWAFSGCYATIYVMRKNDYYTGEGCFNTNHVYGFSYLKYKGGQTGSYFHPYDIPIVQKGANGVLIKGILLENYDDTVVSFYIDNIDGKSSYGELSPKTSHKMVYMMHTAKGDDIKGYYEFETPELQITTNNPRVFNKGDVILGADINLLDDTRNAGFEWRKVDAPDVVPSKTGDAVVYDGRMEGIIKNLDASTYYKVRPYYKAASGEEYFGEWIGFDPSDFSYFEPTVHTYDYVQVVDGVATFVGYAMQGSDDIMSQGFEYWEDGTAHSNGFYAPSSGVNTVTATGQRMTAQVSGLTSDTTYGYRAFVKTNKGITYGEEYQFTTPVSDDIETIYVVHQQTAREGVYTLSGVKVANDLCESKQLPSGIYIVNGKKFVVK